MTSFLFGLSAVPRAGKQQRLARLKGRRKRWLKAHLWLGLGAGFVLTLAGLSGSVLVFWQEIDAALNPGLFRVSARQATTPKALDQLIAAAREQAPSGWKSVYTNPPTVIICSIFIIPSCRRRPNRPSR